MDSILDVEKIDVNSVLSHLNGCPETGETIDTLAWAAGASLGLSFLCMTCILNLISFTDIALELHKELGLRPSLYPDILSRAGIQVSLDAGPGMPTAQWILCQLDYTPLLFCEFRFLNEVSNIIIVGHAGILDTQMVVPGRIPLTHDYEFYQNDRLEEAQYQFVSNPNHATLFYFRAKPHSWQVLVDTYIALAAPFWIEGFPIAIIKLDIPIIIFLLVSPSCFYPLLEMANREVSVAVIIFGEILKIPLLVIK